MADVANPAARAALTTADGQPLKVALARASARARRRAFLLVLPLLAFILITFAVPIGQMLTRSVANDEFSRNMPRLTEWFAANPGDPDEAAFAALAADLAQAAKDRVIGAVGTRINYDVPGTRSLFTSTARSAAELAPPFREALLAENADWARRDLWAAMRNASKPLTTSFYKAAFDR
ncbi:MAG: ABC transporter permease, partial [Albidovulum sp.]